MTRNKNQRSATKHDSLLILYKIPFPDNHVTPDQGTKIPQKQTKINNFSLLSFSEVKVGVPEIELTGTADGILL